MSLPQELPALLPCQCTRHVTNGKPTIQRFCYCLTCEITPDVNKCMCEACAYTCHADHKFCYGGTGPVVCSCADCKCQEPVKEVPFDDEMMPCLGGDLPYQCTISTTKKNFFLQHNYRCLTCKQAVGEGVCAVCARLCHAGHTLQDNGITPFYCDCGNGTIKRFKCHCLTKASAARATAADAADSICLPFEIPFRCTAAEFGEERTYVQRVFTCETCGVGEERAFCEACAARCHPGHKLVDLKLKKAVCRCTKEQCKCQTCKGDEKLVPSLCAEEGINQYNCGCDSSDNCEYGEEEEVEEGMDDDDEQ